MSRNITQDVVVTSKTNAGLYGNESSGSTKDEKFFFKGQKDYELLEKEEHEVSQIREHNFHRNRSVAMFSEANLKHLQIFHSLI